MNRQATYLTTIILGLMTVGCAKNTGSVVSNDPFAAGGDPFQAVANHQKDSNSTYAAKTTSQSQPAGWSRTQSLANQPHHTGSQQPAGIVNTGASLRFQASAPMPEITAEKPVRKKPMPIPPVETVEAPATSGIQQAQFFNRESQSSGITPASFENKMPMIRPRNAPVPTELPATLEMPVFADEAYETPSVKSTTNEPAADEQWWNN